mmetsp:Transcript_45813/g.106444  ORF Transcript_45813/g.106444 Transcript_45813/m.106444 type:complete len:231 (+) Transcript_45813:688-1380(+)
MARDKPVRSLLDCRCILGSAGAECGRPASSDDAGLPFLSEEKPVALLVPSCIRTASSSKARFSMVVPASWTVLSGLVSSTVKSTLQMSSHFGCIRHIGHCCDLALHKAQQRQCSTCPQGSREQSMPSTNSARQTTQVSSLLPAISAGIQSFFTWHFATMACDTCVPVTGRAFWAIAAWRRAASLAAACLICLLEGELIHAHTLFITRMHFLPKQIGARNIAPPKMTKGML